MIGIGEALRIPVPRDDFSSTTRFAVLRGRGVTAIRWRAQPGGGQAATPAGIGKHPIHSMLVGIPIGLWVFALAMRPGAVFNRSGDLEQPGVDSIAGALVRAILAATGEWVAGEAENIGVGQRHGC